MTSADSATPAVQSTATQTDSQRGKTKMIGKKRLALAAGSITAAGAVATLVAGTTFGLFSASSTASNANTFTTGTVSVGAPGQATCAITNMVPGDQSANY